MNMQIIDHQKRIFEGYASVEVKDKDGDLFPISDVLKYMIDYADIGGVLHDSHTYKVVGKMLNWLETDKNGIPAVKIIGRIYDNLPFHDAIWKKIKNGEYGGLSIGGEGTLKEDGQIQIDGGLFEISVCERGANRESTIEAVSFAKSEEEKEEAKEDKEEDDTNGDTMKKSIKKQEEEDATIEPAPAEETVDAKVEEASKLDSILEAVTELKNKVATLEERMGTPTEEVTEAEDAPEEKEEEKEKKEEVTEEDKEEKSEEKPKEEEEKKKLEEIVKVEVKKAFKNITKAKTPNPSVGDNANGKSGAITGADIAMGRAKM